MIPSNSTDTGHGAWLPFTGPTNNSSHSLVVDDRLRSVRANSRRSRWLLLHPSSTESGTVQVQPTTRPPAVPSVVSAFCPTWYWQSRDVSRPTEDSTNSADPDTSSLPFSLLKCRLKFSWTDWHSVAEAQTKNSSHKLRECILNAKSSSKMHLTSLKPK